MDIIKLMLLSRQMKNRRHEKNNMVTGIPPLTFTANKTGLLKNYRIYGNTETKTRSYSGSAPLSFPIVDGAVGNYRVYGQKSRNLYDGEFLQGYWAYANGIFLSSNAWVCTTKIACIGNTAYTFSFNNASRWAGFVWYDANGDYISTDNRDSGFGNGGNFTATSPSNAAYMIVNIAGYPNTSSNIAPSDVTNFMLVEGSAALPYEPYGESVGNLVTDSQSEHYGKYAIPITNNSETANIYLDEPLAKSGDIADYIDYMAQKRHNSDGTESSVTQPEIAVTAGTNTLTVGTEVQPSRVELTGRIKEAQTNGSGNT